MGEYRARNILTFLVVTAVSGAVAWAWSLGVLGRHLIGSGREEFVILLGIMTVGLVAGTAAQHSIRAGLLDAHLATLVALGLVGGSASTAVYALYPLTELFLVVLYGAALLIGAAVGILTALRQRLIAAANATPADPRPFVVVALLCLVPLAAYVVVTRISLALASAVLGGLVIAGAVAGAAMLRPKLARARSVGTVAVFAGVSLVALGVAAVFGNDWTERPEQRLLKDPIVHRQLDRFVHLVVTKRGELVRLYVNGLLKFSSKDESVYSDVLVHPAMTLASSRSRVLLLGRGDGMALREILRYDDVEHVTVAHLDPPLVALASTQTDLVRLNDGAFADPRVTLLPLPLEHSQTTMERVWMRNERRVARHAPNMEIVARRQVARVDANALLDGVGGSFDLAIVDWPDPRNVQTTKLYSVELFRELRRRLTDDAVVALQATSVFYAKEAFLCMGATVRAAGFSAVPYHQNVPSSNERGFYVAMPGSLRADAMLARLRSIDALAVESRFITPETVAASTYFGKGWLESSAPITVNSSANLVLLDYYLRGWNLY